MVATFHSANVDIAYYDEGEGEPVTLVHGFASSFARNWRNTNWVDFLTRSGFRVLGLDLRGHGASTKLYDPRQYGTESMAQDVLNLLDHLHMQQTDLMGYSMGGSIALHLLIHHPERFRKAILGGLGDTAIREGAQVVRPAHIAAALETDDPESIADPVARRFRGFAERSANDLRALAAVMRRAGSASTPERVRQIRIPVLVVAGANDDIAGGATQLAQAIPDAQLVIVPDRDHLTVVADQRYKDAVLEFLKTND